MNFQPSPMMNMWELNPAMCYMSTGYNTKATNDQEQEMRSSYPTPRILDKNFTEMDQTRKRVVQFEESSHNSSFGQLLNA